MKIFEKNSSENLNARYFTTGEAARLSGISRKTLLFYDSEALVTPEIVDANGYRYYRRSQLLLLRLVVTLRQIGVPIGEIKAYLARRSPDAYRSMLRAREARLEAEIAGAQARLAGVRAALARIERPCPIDAEETTLEQRGAAYLFMGEELPDEAAFRERSAACARLFAALAARGTMSGHVFGAIVDRRALAAPARFARRVTRYYIPLASPLDDPRCALRPAGRYAVTHFRGTYMHASRSALLRFEKQLAALRLRPRSALYITSLQNIWTAASPDEYLHRVEVLVTPERGECPD